MPKRKHSHSREKNIEYYKNKIKKLMEREIREQQANDSNQGSDFEETVNYEDITADTPALRPDDWLLSGHDGDHTNELTSIQPQFNDEPAPSSEEPQPGVSQLGSKCAEPQPGPSCVLVDENVDSDLDTAIYGEEPENRNKRGPEIHSKLAKRLIHLAKEGVNKEDRAKLLLKYPLPENLTQLDAPQLNMEIKAALLETAIKRDKGIETKQKQLSSAIACLAGIINDQIKCKPKNDTLEQKLFDMAQILCDLQHADSVTRRNFILFTLKNDMKEHLKNTSIDTHLFGENLAETLKAAKAVNKSGVELKADTINKSATIPHKGTAQRPLNRKAPPQAYRQPAGTAPTAPRSREPAAARAHPTARPRYQQQQHARSSRTSSQAHQGTYPRRRY